MWDGCGFSALREDGVTPKLLKQGSRSQRSGASWKRSARLIFGFSCTRVRIHRRHRRDAAPEQRSSLQNEGKGSQHFSKHGNRRNETALSANTSARTTTATATGKRKANETALAANISAQSLNQLSGAVLAQASSEPSKPFGVLDVV